MNILFISNEYPLWNTGGKGTFIQTFARELVAQGHNASVLGIGDTTSKQVFEDEGVQLIRLRTPVSPVARFIENSFRINNEIKRLQNIQSIDVVETSELDAAYLPINTPYKKVIRLHGGHHFFAEAEKRRIDSIKGKREKKSFKNADAFIAISNYVKSHTEKYLSFNNKPVVMINNLIDTSVEVSEIEIDEHTILFAGTVCEKKGINELLAAFQLIRAQYPDKHLDIYGRDWLYPDGTSFIATLKKQYQETYFKNVTFHGAIDRRELFRKYQRASVCVFPSHMETQGLVTLEAMLMECPVIFTTYGPGPETITHMDTGLLCDVYQPADIAGNVIWCFENKTAAQELGKKARQHVLLNYNKDAIVTQNLEFYSSIKNLN